MEYGLLLASAAVSAMTRLLGRLRRPRPPRILVVKLDHLGDVVTATPVFRALRDAFPGAAIDALVGSGSRDVLAGNPFVDRIHDYDARRFLRTGRRAPSSRETLRRLRAIAAARYTHIVELRGDTWTLLLPFLCGALRRVDRGTVRIAMRLRLRRFPLLRRPAHEVETNLAIVRPLCGARDLSDRVEVFVTDAERQAARARLAAAGVDSARPLVLLQPGATWRPRAWRPENFATLADRLADRHGAAVVFLGGRAEADIGERLRALAPDRPFAYFFGTHSLREAIALVAEAALVVANDGGIAHIASGCGTPVVALFGHEPPERFRPWSPRAVALHHRVECCPCTQRVCVLPDNPCVNLITVEEVEQAAARFLGGGPSA
jgi:lipopolysaccharide heptosyltransferase II